MRRSAPSGREVAIVVWTVTGIGVLLVAYSLGLATWLSNSDSGGVGFIDLAPGDSPSVQMNEIERWYFNGGAWYVLALIAVAAVVAIASRLNMIAGVALVASVGAALGHAAVVGSTDFVDLQFGAYLASVGYAVVASAMAGSLYVRRSPVPDGA